MKIEHGESVTLLISAGQRGCRNGCRQWQERQRQRARGGQMTAADRWMARAQRKSDERAARWQELEPLRQLVTAAPIKGPGDSAAVISVDQSGARWLSPLSPAGPIGPGDPAELFRLLITEAIWLVVFRRSYTIHVVPAYQQTPRERSERVFGIQKKRRNNTNPL
jgi:hypothetical protein